MNDNLRIRKIKIVFLLRSSSVYLAMLLGTMLASFNTYAQRPFITTWVTNEQGVSNNTSITIPTDGEGYNYEVDWDNDGIYDESGITGNVTHDFGKSGVYTIRIRGDFPRILFGYGGDRKKFYRIEQWGDQVWTSMQSAFTGCVNLDINASDLPNLSKVTSMGSMFAYCIGLYGQENMGDWNTSSVLNMAYLFEGASNFNQPIGSWNTSNVYSMGGMFGDAYSFNQPIGNWNTAKVEIMREMFSGANSFNQPIGNWNTGKVTDMGHMFSYTWAFNQPIGTWNMSNVTSADNMFNSANSFNQPIGNWKTSKMVLLYGMFSNATAFNQPIGNWDMSNAFQISNMFTGATSFNQPIGNWNVAKVAGMIETFAGATAFNQPIGNWNTARVVSMARMFQGATAFNQPIGNWNTARVNHMGGMFSGAVAFNQSLENWVLNPIVNLTMMFDNSGLDCGNYSATLIGWSANPKTPVRRVLGAAGMLCMPNALAAHANLEVTKGWTIVGDTSSDENCSPLPVHLTTFTGKSQGNGTMLSWETTSETNNAGFEIEKSLDAKSFEKIGFVDGAGDTRETNTYHFLDTEPFPTTYYRLKQLDHGDRFDGKFAYSSIIVVRKPGDKIVVYPNPASNVFYIQGIEKKQNLVIRDAVGKIVDEQICSSTKAIEIDHLPNGLYFISIAGETRKIIVQNKVK